MPQLDGQQPTVQPIPSPQTFQVRNVEIGGRPWVMLLIFHAAGTHVSFIEPDNAIRIGGGITKAGHQAKSGLTIAKEVPRDPRDQGS